MKKVILSLSLIMILVFSACSAGKTPVSTPAPTPVPTPAPTETPASAPSVEALRDSYFLRVAETEFGTAGASLKQAVTACDVVTFALDQHLSTADIPTLRANMLSAWESLTPDQQHAFDNMMFNTLRELIETAFSDYSSVSGRFEDAGVHDAMSALVSNEDAAACWSTLISHTFTLGNSDGE